MSNLDLITQCFYYLNTFKRHRALTHLKKTEGKSEESQYHELKQYQFLDNLELGLRALQKGMYEEKGGLTNGNIQTEKFRTNQEGSANS